MAAEENAGAGNDDVKARMREALERKQSNDRGVEHKGHGKEKARTRPTDR